MEIKKSKLVATIANPEQCPNNDMPELILLGRSNVGKSSFINSIANNRKLAFVGAKPGRTRTINFYLLNESFYLVDLPGYGYAKASWTEKDRWHKSIDEYLKSRLKSINAAFFLLDIRHAPSDDDKLMWEWLQYYGIDTVVVATKADKLNRSQINERINSLRKELGLYEDVPVVPFSALTKQGREQVLMLIDKILEEYDVSEV